MLDQNKTSGTTELRVGAPTLVWANVREDIYYCGLSDDLRGTYDAIRYAKHEMSESEYSELYKCGSDEYRNSADITVKRINLNAAQNLIQEIKAAELTQYRIKAGK